MDCLPHDAHSKLPWGCVFASISGAWLPAFGKCRHDTRDVHRLPDCRFCLIMVRIGCSDIHTRPITSFFLSPFPCLPGSQKELMPARCCSMLMMARLRPTPLALRTPRDGRLWLLCPAFLQLYLLSRHDDPWLLFLPPVIGLARLSDVPGALSTAASPDCLHTCYLNTEYPEPFHQAKHTSHGVFI